jgi:hypothetical protein
MFEFFLPGVAFGLLDASGFPPRRGDAVAGTLDRPPGSSAPNWRPIRAYAG